MTNGFIKMSNKIFDYNLSPKAFRVYTYLLSVSTHQKAVVKYDTIASACGISARTAFDAVRELIGAKLVTKRNQYGYNGFTANKYYLANLTKTGGWFKIARDVIKNIGISAYNFMVYCYVSRQKNKDGFAFPSLSSISSNLNISRSKVCAALAKLRRQLILNRTHRRYQKTKAFRHNMYHYDFTVQNEVDVTPSELTSIRTNQQPEPSFTRFVTLKIAHFLGKVKSFLKNCIFLR